MGRWEGRQLEVSQNSRITPRGVGFFFGVDSEKKRGKKPHPPWGLFRETPVCIQRYRIFFFQKLYAKQGFLGINPRGWGFFPPFFSESSTKKNPTPWGLFWNSRTLLLFFPSTYPSFQEYVDKGFFFTIELFKNWPGITVPKHSGVKAPLFSEEERWTHCVTIKKHLIQRLSGH